MAHTTPTSPGRCSAGSNLHVARSSGTRETSNPADWKFRERGGNTRTRSDVRVHFRPEPSFNAPCWETSKIGFEDELSSIQPYSESKNIAYDSSELEHLRSDYREASAPIEELHTNYALVEESDRDKPGQGLSLEIRAPVQKHRLFMPESQKPSLATKLSSLRKAGGSGPWIPWPRVVAGDGFDDSITFQGYGNDLSDDSLPHLYLSNNEQDAASSIDTHASLFPGSIASRGVSSKISSGEHSSRTFSSLESETGYASLVDYPCAEGLPVSCPSRQDLHTPGSQLQDERYRSQQGNGHIEPEVCVPKIPEIEGDQNCNSSCEKLDGHPGASIVQRSNISKPLPNSSLAMSPDLCPKIDTLPLRCKERVEPESMLGSRSPTRLDGETAVPASSGKMEVQGYPSSQSDTTSPKSVIEQSSEDDTDWDAGSDMDEEELHNLWASFDSGVSNQDDNEAKIIKIILRPMKDAMVERIMKEFWLLFNQEWAANLRKCGTSSTSPPTSTSNEQTSSRNLSDNRGFKRSRQSASGGSGGGDGEDDNDDTQDDGERPPKRHKDSMSPSAHLGNSLGFACPFRKHDPQKYNLQWRSCALTPRQNVARVKAHLYRKHMVYQCSRCQELFSSDQDLEDHFLENECERQTSVPVDGVTPKMQKQLQSRKKSHIGQTEAERWEALYHIIYPDEVHTPSPYFEPVQDGHDTAAHSPDSREIADYEEYYRQELPKYFRGLLERTANTFEEGLRVQIIGMVREAQEHVAASYRKGVASSAGSLTYPTMAPETKGFNSRNDPMPSTTPGNIFETFYQPPPVQAHLRSAFQWTESSSEQIIHERDDPSDSGYMSNFSLTELGQLEKIKSSSTTFSGSHPATGQTSRRPSATHVPSPQPFQTSVANLFDTTSTKNRFPYSGWVPASHLPGNTLVTEHPHPSPFDDNMLTDWESNHFQGMNMSSEEAWNFNEPNPESDHTTWATHPND